MVSFSFSSVVPLAETTVRHELFWEASGVNIPTALQFSDFANQIAFLARNDSKRAIDVFEEACLDHLVKDHPTWTLNDILPRAERHRLPEDLLPPALPPELRTCTKASEHTEIPDSFRDSMALTITKVGAGSVSIDLKLPRLVDRRLTLDWIETATDTLQPVLRLDGEALSFTGTVPSFAKSETLTDAFILSYQARGKTTVERPKHDAGTLVFLHFDLYSASEQTARRLRQELSVMDPAAALTATASEWPAREAFLGRIGCLMANTYFMRWGDSQERAYSLHGTRHKPGSPCSFQQIYLDPATLHSDVSLRGSFGVLAAWNIDTSLTAGDGARIMDAAGTSLGWGSDLATNIRNLAMFDSSGNEAWNFSDWQSSPALSTVAGLRQALHDGQPVFRIKRVATNSYSVSARILDAAGSVLVDSIHEGTYDKSTITAWLTTAIGTGHTPYSASRVVSLFEELDNSSKQPTLTLPINRVTLSYAGDSGATTTMQADLWISQSSTADGYLFSLDPLVVEEGGGTAYDSYAYDYYDMYSPGETFSTEDSCRETGSSLYADRPIRVPGTITSESAPSTAGDPVTLQSGEYVAEELPDLQLPSAGFSLALVRRYGSRIGYDGPFGYGWGWSHSERILQTILPSGDGYAANSCDIFYMDAQRGCHTIRRLASSEWEMPPGAGFLFDKLGNGTYRIYRRDLVTLEFDADGRLVRKVDRNGNALTITRNTGGDPVSISDDFGQSFSLTYGSVSDKVETVEDSAGRVVYYLYGTNPVDVNDDPLANYFAEHGVPAATQEAIHAALASHATAALPNPTLADLGAPDDLVAFVDADGAVTTYAYLQGYPSDSLLNHNMTRYTLPNGEFLELDYQQNDTVAQHRNSRGDTFSFRYNFANNNAETWNEQGWYRQVVWNDHNDVIRISEQDRMFVRSTYDDRHNLLARTDGDGCTTLFTYDDRNSLLTSQVLARPAEGVTTWTVFDHDAGTIRTSDATSYTLAQYASLSRSQRLALGAEYREAPTTYAGTTGTSFFRPLASEATDPLGETTELAYDACGRLVSTQFPEVDGRIVRVVNTYSSEGELATTQRQVSTDGGINFVAVPSTLTTYGHDTSSLPFRLTSITDAYGAVTRFSEYDAAGRLTSMEDPAGAFVHSSYTSVGRLWRQTLPTAEASDDGTLPAVEHRYDSLGRPTATIGPDRAVVATTYAPARDIVQHADPARVTDALGFAESFVYDAVGNVTARTDRNGETWSFAYDGMGRVLAATAPDGTVRRNVWNGRGQLAATTDPEGATTEYGYDAAGRPAWESDPLGNTTRRVYDPAGRLVAIIPPEGAITLMAYDARGRLVERTLLDDLDADGVPDAGEEARINTFAYDDLDRVVRESDPLGHYTRYLYDIAAGGAPAIYSAGGEIDPAGRSYALPMDAPARNRVVLRFERTGTDVWKLLSQSVSLYDERGLLIRSLDPLGHATDFDYDEQRRLVGMTDALGTVTEHDYDVTGNRVATRVFSPAPHSFRIAETRWTYNLRREQLAEIRVLIDGAGNESGTVTRCLATDPVGNRIATIDGEGQVWRTARDVLGRVVAEADPLGNASITVRDGNGRPQLVADPVDNITEYAYDLRGLPVLTTDPAGIQIGQAYDNRGLPTIETIDPQGMPVSHITGYSAFGETVFATAANGTAGNVESTVVYARDLVGRVVCLAADQDSGGTNTFTMTYAYDGAGRIVAEMDADSSLVSYFYDAAGNRRLEVKRDGSIVARLYDPLGRVTDVYTFPTGTSPASLVTDADIMAGTRRQHFVYDALGRLVLATDYNGDGTGDDHTVAFTYNSLNEPVAEAQSFANGQTTYTVVVAYDKRSAPVALTYPSGANAAIGYDERGLPVAFTYDPGTGPVTEATCEYDAAGRLVGTLLGYGHEIRIGGVPGRNRPASVARPGV